MRNVVETVRFACDLTTSQETTTALSLSTVSYSSVIGSGLVLLGIGDAADRAAAFTRNAGPYHLIVRTQLPAERSDRIARQYNASATGRVIVLDKCHHREAAVNVRSDEPRMLPSCLYLQPLTGGS
jgi:hypothetical protein